MSWFRPRVAAVAAVAVLVVGAVAGCGGEEKPVGVESPAGAGFPVTIKHAFGATTIPAKPQRIVTLGWNAQDIVYALGETPVGMPRITYGPTDKGVSAWQVDKFDPAKTTLIDAGDKYPLEKIAGLDPDVILSPYDGFDAATFKQLSEIAPTVAYPGAPWQTSWQDQTKLVGQALGKTAEADQLIAGIAERVAKVAAEHPEFKGKTIAVGSFGAENYLYMPGDPRVQILNEMGFKNSPGVEALEKTNAKKEFAMTVSKEKVATSADADVLVAYVDGLGRQKFLADPVYQSLGAVKRGAVYAMDDQQVISGMSAVSVLSVPWVLDKIVPELSKAAKTTTN